MSMPRKSCLARCLLAAALAVTSGSVWSHAIKNGQVVDDNGNPVQLRGVNWFGFDTNVHTVHGLWARNWKDMITQMQGLGFNAVRLPFCPQSLSGVAPSSIDYGLNPDLQGLNSLQVMDKVIDELSSRGMYVLLDHHTPDCNAISELWYTSSYSEQQWIDDLTLVATRYAAVPGVIGIDLKNEPHGAATWGTGNAATDWNTAAERASAAVLKVAPKWLIVVEGISENPSCSSSGGHFWGENLEPLSCTPLNIPADRLLLAPHVYGPDVSMQSYFSASNFPANMPAIWDQHFGRFATSGQALLLGEFGGKYGQGSAQDVTWQNALVDYLIGKGIHGGFYWSWNPNSNDTGGILNDDWSSVRTDKVTLLKKLWATH
ncbi:endoglucanase [Luteibacter sp. PvP120]